MNSVQIIGRITKDLQLTTAGQYHKCDFTLAVNRFGKKNEADFINCVVWGKTAENLVNYMGKGSLIGIEGSIRVDSYDKDGRKNYITKVNATQLHFLDSRKNNNSSEQGNNYSQSYQAPNESQFKSQQPPVDDVFKEFDISNDDLPF